MSDDDGTLTEPVYWKGEQWAATGYGVEGLKNVEPLKNFAYYNIPSSDLNMLDRDGMSSWPEHMAMKNDVDAADFNRAFYEALKAHKIELPAKAMAALELLVKLRPRNDNFK